MSGTSAVVRVQIPARDGYALGATHYRALERSGRVAIINSATAVPQSFYRHFAARLQSEGYDVVTYDYRGIGQSRPESLRGFKASMRDWGLVDMAGVVDWASESLDPEKLFLVGHSVGGQLAGLLDNAEKISAMLTFSAQSGYWRLQGAEQKAAVALHVHVTLPLLSSVFGYMPWSKFGATEDLPKSVALEWSSWCRNPEYLLGDDSLPLDRYACFQAPVLAYSFDDDKWGTAAAVDAMMKAYPNLERRHRTPGDLPLPRIGHFGFFRKSADHTWDEALSWLAAH